MSNSGVLSAYATVQFASIIMAPVMTPRHPRTPRTRIALSFCSESGSNCLALARRVARLEPTALSSFHVLLFPSADARTCSVEQALVVGLADGEARLRCQLGENRIPEMKDAKLRGLIGRCDNVSAEEKAIGERVQELRGALFDFGRR